jgi:hypothetical protein
MTFFYIFLSRIKKFCCIDLFLVNKEKNSFHFLFTKFETIAKSDNAIIAKSSKIPPQAHATIFT